MAGDDSDTIYAPSDMLAAYKNIIVTADDNRVSVSINCYKNFSHTGPSGCADAMVIKQKFLQLGSAGILARCGYQGYMDVFTGKGSPEGIAAFLTTLVDYSDKFIATFKESGGPVQKVAEWLADDSLDWGETLQNFCDTYLGLDCNGFVGNWLKKCDHSLQISPNNQISYILSKMKVTRMSIDQIQYADVIIWKNLSHIASIDDATAGSASKFNVCQSAGGGPRINEFIINATAPGIFVLTGGSEWATKNVPGSVQIFNPWPE